MSEIPEPSISPATMLFAMVSSVCTTAGDTTVPAAATTHHGTLGPGTVPISHGDTAATRLAIAELELAVRTDMVDNLDSRMMVEIERAQQLHSEYPRKFGKQTLPQSATKSNETRGIEKTELCTFTSLSPNDIDRTTQLVAFERLLNTAYDDIIGSNNISPWVLTNRSLFEHHPPHILPQILASCMLSDPTTLASYHPATDCALLALHNPTARGRCGQNYWRAKEHVRLRPTFDEWRVSPRLNATPRSMAAKSTGIDLTEEEMKGLTTHTMHLFPADHATVVIRTMDGRLDDVVRDGVNIPVDTIGGAKNSFMSVYGEGNVFGLRHREADAGEVDEAVEKRPDTKGMEAHEVSKVLHQYYNKTALFAAHYVADLQNGVRVTASEGTKVRGASAREGERERYVMRARTVSTFHPSISSARQKLRPSPP